jgi:hypothetical protein
LKLKLTPYRDDTVAITANKKSNEVNLEELQAQLASIIAERDAALEKCNKLEAQIGASSDQSRERCLFLDKLPIEIRREIYALLLTNDILSEWRSMNNWGVNAWGPPAPGITFEYTPNYDLSPELLRTCRQIYVEGCEILYGSNTYIIDCTMSEAFYSPIVRNAKPAKGGHPGGVSHGSNPERMKDIPAIKKVQHWKLFLSTDEEVCHDTIPQSLSGLCEAIHNTPAKSIQVFIVPQGDMFRNMDPWHTRGNSMYHKIELLLQPLRILRNMSEFELREANVDEVRNFIPSADMSLLTPLKFLPGFKEELKSLVQRSEPSVSISHIYDNLLAYAQSFEQQPRYKQAMNPIYGDYRARYEYADGLDETIEGERVEDINYFVPRTDISLLYPRRGDTSFSPLNPFMRHPVEISLSLAAAGREIQNLKMLKRGRGSVLELLEPQYQKVLAASRNFANVVKYYKVPGKIFDVNLQRDTGNWIDFHSSGDALSKLLIFFFAHFGASRVPSNLFGCLIPPRY